MPAEHWKDQPEPHDFPAAGDYVSLCASYHLDENANVPCRLVGLP